jgi:hypothetical protein
MASPPALKILVNARCDLLETSVFRRSAGRKKLSICMPRHPFPTPFPRICTGQEARLVLPLATDNKPLKNINRRLFKNGEMLGAKKVQGRSVLPVREDLNFLK